MGNISGAQTGIDFRAKFLRLCAYSFIAGVIVFVAWGIVTIGSHMFRQAQQLRCQNNLRQLAHATQYYRDQHGTFPPYLAALTRIVDHREAFICPSDPNRGTEGSRPPWLQRYDRHLDERDGVEGFRYVDLDGPTLTDSDENWLPSSYLYAANGYPSGLAYPPFSRTWRDLFEEAVEEYGSGVPLVRCFHHLPEQYLPPEQDPIADPDDPRTVRTPHPTAEPTLNVTADLRIVRYPYRWQEAPEFADSR